MIDLDFVSVHKKVKKKTRPTSSYLDLTLGHSVNSSYTHILDDLTKTGSATQSSSAVPEMIADQGFDNDRLTCIATNDQTDLWWKIDLGSNHDVEEVVIYLPSEGSIPFSSECDVYVGKFFLYKVKYN